MKKHLLLLLLLFSIFSIGKAQEDNSARRAEKIQALKIAFITQKLQLKPAEAQKFWPVYNEYQDEITNLRANRKGDDVLENEEKLLNIRKKYKPSFQKILGAEKLNDLFNAERDFRIILIRRLKNHNQQRPR